jgi:hypothetical protein
LWVASVPVSRGKKREARPEKPCSEFASNLDVTGKGFITGKGLLKRILLTLALACGFLLFLAAVDANATPIHPDIRKIVSQEQQETTTQFMAARAGWDGPEMRVAAALPVHPGTGSAGAVWAEFIAAATPDPRAILGIAVLIFLLRLLKKQEEKRTPGAAANQRAAVVSMPARPSEDDSPIAA